MPGTMLASSNGAPARQDAAAVKKRNRVMCRMCRRDKQLCQPSNRAWEKGEKCDRCIRLDYSCSAPERAPFKPRKKRPAAVTTGPPHFHAAGPQEPRARPLSAFGAEAESVLPSTAVPPPSQPEPDGTITSTRKSGEQEARTILIRLGDLNATHLLLRLIRRLCDQVESWVGPCKASQKIRAAMSAAIEAIQLEFFQRWRDAKALAPKDIGPIKEAFLSQLEHIKYRFCHPPQSASCSFDDAVQLAEQLDDDDVQEMLHDLHKRKKMWSAADYLFGNPSRRSRSRHPAQGNSEADVVFCYAKASEGVKSVLSSIVLQDADHREILFGFSIGFNQAPTSISALPPCHLAVPHANASVMFDLWKQSSMPLWDVDFLRRTPVHTAAYAGDIQGLQQIFQHEPLTASNTGHDMFGLTPLGIAACQDDVVTFIKLQQAGASIFERTGPNIVDHNGAKLSLLALAARNGSTKVMEHILSPAVAPLICTVASSELYQALSSGHTHAAQILIDRHRQRDNCYDLTEQVADAMRVAEEKGFHGIFVQLTALTPPFADRQQALNSVDNTMFESFIDQNMAWDTETQYDYSQLFGHFGSQSSGAGTTPWGSQETPGTSFAYSDMQDSSIPTPVTNSGMRPRSAPRPMSRQIRHHGPIRVDPP